MRVRLPSAALLKKIKGLDSDAVEIGGMAYSNPEDAKRYKARWYIEHRGQHLSNVRKNNKLQRKRLRQFIDDFKVGKKCGRCPEDAACCLDFHHTDPKQKIKAISRIASDGRWSIAKLQTEIAKCELLCKNCHAKQHA